MVDLREAIRGLVHAMAQAPDLCDEILPALQVLTEWQAAAPSGGRLEQFTKLHCTMSGLSPGDRMRAVRERMGISKTRYYDLLAQSRKVPKSPVLDGTLVGEDHQP